MTNLRASRADSPNAPVSAVLTKASARRPIGFRPLGLALSIVLLAIAMLCSAPVLAQAAGPAMSVQLVLSGFADNDGSGTVTLGDQLDFTTTATNTGSVPLTNVQIVDTFDPVGKACGTIPPATGNTCQFTSTHIVTAADVAAGTVTDTATVTSSELPPQTAGSGSPVNTPPTLTIVSGDGQVIAPGVASAPLIVQLTNMGMPVANAVITWHTNGATLASPTSTTDASGRATNTATVLHAGVATVSASSANPVAGPVTFTLNGGLSDVTGLTPEEVEVANALDHACPAIARLTTPSPAQLDLLRQCQALASAGARSPAVVGDILNELLPHDALLQTSASLLVTSAQFDNVKARLAALRSGTGGDHFGGLAFSTPDGVLPVGKLGDALLGFDSHPDNQKQEAGADFERWGFFASGTFGHGFADARTQTPGYGFHTSGITAGVDYRYNDHVVFGVSVGYNNYSSSVDFLGGGMDTHGWTLSAYSTLFRQDNWYLDGVVSFGNNTYDIDRRFAYAINTGSSLDVVNQAAKSNSSGHTFADTLTLGRDFSKGPWSYGPYVRATWARTNFGSYLEQLAAGPGNGLGLSVQGRSSESLQSVLGAKLDLAASTSWGVVMPHTEMEWVHEFRASPDRLNASFLQDPTATPFQLQGDAIDTDYFKFGMGMSFVFPHGRSGFFYVERTLGLSGLTQANISAGFRMEF